MHLPFFFFFRKDAFINLQYEEMNCELPGPILNTKLLCVYPNPSDFFKKQRDYGTPSWNTEHHHVDQLQFNRWKTTKPKKTTNELEP